MEVYEAVLIYDGECPYCSILARVMEKIGNLGVISWHESASQKFLLKQFDEIPFSMFLVDNELGKVYSGESAANELCKRAGLPNMVGNLIKERYKGITKAVDKASGRRRKPDDFNGEFELNTEAEKCYEMLAEGALNAPLSNKDSL